jgi:hypothetical protein
MVVFNVPYSNHLQVNVPKGMVLTEAALMGGQNLEVKECAANEYYVSVPSPLPLQPFVIKLSYTKKNTSSSQYRKALT